MLIENKISINKINMRKILMLAMAAMFSLTVFSQNNSVKPDTADYPYWVEMMQDPNANFFETQKAFYKYWEEREITRGSGYKPFKRWENMMRTRVDKYGNKPKVDDLLKAYNKAIEQKKISKGASGNWNLVGPVDLPNPQSGQPNGLGRINVIAFHPFSENTIYIGAPAGGFWRTYDNGENWETTTDRLPTLGVSAIVVNHKNPNIIYIGTGDRDANDAAGMGVFKSNDGGTTWEQKNTGMGNVTVNKMLIHPDYPNTIFAATSNGIYKSTDGGETWNMKTSGTCKTMEFKPFQPDVIYAIKGSSFYKSKDNGESWTRISSGLQTWSRAVIGVSPANPNYVYILSTYTRAFKAMYFSEDSGENFVTKSTTPNIMGYSTNGSDNGGQAWYDLCIAVDRTYADIVYSGGVNIFKSSNKGEDWTINAHWIGQGGAPAVHADNHDMAVNPLNNRIYTANDGGIYYTDNGGSSWINISSGISISQIYKIGQSSTKRDMVLCGNQDNGTSYYYDSDWSVVLGGDGMECIIDGENYRYGSLYYGNIRRSKYGGAFYSIIQNISDNGAWVTPYVLNAGNSKTMYIGMKSVWRTTDVQRYTVSWKNISSGITGSYTMVDLENSPANPNILYASREDGKMFISTNANATTPTWKQLYGGLPTSIITDIEAHPFNENIVYVTASNHNVYKSINKGASWTKITGNLPRVSMNAIVYDKTSNEGLYVGTDIGVFYKDATMQNWVYYSTGLPATAKITELEIYYDNANPDNNVLRGSTYGRGLWESFLFSEDITLADNARIIELLNPSGIYNQSNNIKPEITIKNTGSNVLTSVNVVFFVDNNTPDTLNFNLNLATFDTETLELPAFSTEIGNHICKFKLIKANDQVILNEISSIFSVNKVNAINLKLNTDLNASQISWKIFDSEDNVLYTSPVYVDDSSYTVSDTFYLTEGCYKYVIYDTNGLGTGDYALNNLTTGQVLGSGSAFTDSATVDFCIELPVPDFKASKIYIKPNEVITFENKTTDNGYSYSWNFGKDAVPATYSGTTPPEVYYSTDGYKNVILTVSNNDNTVSKILINYIKVYDEPVIITQPAAVTLCHADTIEMNVDAKGFGLTYTWYRDAVKIFESTNGKLKIENAQPVNKGNYYCKISNIYYTVYSDTVAVSLLNLPDLSVSTSDSVVCSGTEVTLTATGTGTFNWSNGLGTNPVITDTPDKSTTYSVSLTNQQGCVNNKEISVVVAATPTISVQPENKEVCKDESVIMLVDASGNALNYKWLLNDTDVIGEGSNVMYIDSAKPKHQGSIICKVSNVCGNVESNSVVLTVNPLPVAGFSYEESGAKITFKDESQNAQYYNWDFGDGYTSSQIEPSHTYSESNNYKVLQTVENDCGNDTTSLTIAVTVGIGDNLFENEKLNIYPNPVSSSFNMELVSPEYRGNIKIVLMNIDGKVILNQNINKSDDSLTIPFNVSLYSKGMYQLQIVMGDRVIVRKIIIN
jgi:PKD repeat protein/photosystem II stability/assembly factor-like uncharacterized protein